MNLPRTMPAMVLERLGEPLVWHDLPVPSPGRGEVLVKVEACGVCRTDLHLVDGELQDPKLPVVPGHEVVGRVAALGSGVSGLELGQRVGIPWLAHTCGVCSYCRAGQENLCDAPLFAGYTRDGGYAGYAVADAHFCFALPEESSAVAAAPLLCAGLIGYRSYKFAGDARRLGIFGFGAAAHLVSQIAAHDGRRVFAFTRPGDTAAQEFARSLGAAWAGSSEETSPEELDAAILFAPVGALVPAALRSVRKGGVVVCGGIHMTDIPSFPYSALWGERVVRSVANLTRRDGEELLALAPRIPLTTHTEQFPLAEANQALAALRAGRLQGAAVLVTPT